MNQNLSSKYPAGLIGTFMPAFFGIEAIDSAGNSAVGVALAGLIYRRFLIKDAK